MREGRWGFEGWRWSFLKGDNLVSAFVFHQVKMEVWVCLGPYDALDFFCACESSCWPFPMVRTGRSSSLAHGNVAV